MGSGRGARPRKKREQREQRELPFAAVSAPRPRHTFLTDEDVSDEIGDLLLARGHRLFRAREVQEGASDDEVAHNAESLGASVVTRNAKHYKKQLGRRQAQTPRFRSAGLITLELRSTDEVDRLRQVLDLVEAELEMVRAHADPRVVMEVHDDHVRVVR